MDTGFRVTIQPGKTTDFVRILLKDKDELEFYEDCKVEKLDRDDEYATIYIRNLQKLGSCPQLANCRFIIYDDDNTKVLLEGSSVSLLSLESLLFESVDNGINYCLTEKGKHICNQLLVGYKVLEDNEIYFSKGECPENILFLVGDQQHLYPRITNFYDDKFVDSANKNNYMKLRSLLKTLLGTRCADASLQSFLSSTTGDYHLAVNHPALWRKESPYYFVQEAATYIKKEPHAITPLYNRDKAWKNSLGQSLKDYYKIAVKKRKQIHNQEDSENTTGDYHDNAKGEILFKRDTFTHYNENKKRTDNVKSILEIEEWFHESLPTFNSKMYFRMKECGFQFVDKPRRFS